MFLSKAKLLKSAKVAAVAKAETKEEDKRPKLDDFLKARDYTGAVTLLEFQRQIGDIDDKTLPWLAYCAFHLGDYQKALDVYKELINSSTSYDPVYHLYAACCLFHLGLYAQAAEAALKGPEIRLQTRILLHCAQKMGDKDLVAKHRAHITDSAEDQLSLAAIDYSVCHFQDASEIYKKLLNEFKDAIALHVYIALCYYKLDYYDVSLELSAPYLQKFPNSAITINLKACNAFKQTGNGERAEAELKTLMDTVSSSHDFDDDLIRHNLVVFRGGENALQILPPLVDVIPEARLNLVIYHLKNNEIKEAYDLIKNLEHVGPLDYILTGVVNACWGQQTNSAEYILRAQQFYQAVGISNSEVDTIPGRQCMASCLFLMKQFEEVLVYLNSIKDFCLQDDNFNYNYGIALAAVKLFKEAEEALLAVKSEKFRAEYMYLSTLARCLIMNGKANDAWELYLKMDNENSFQFLILIANDCYKSGAFYYAAKAFDVLERLDPSPDNWDGKRGACCGVFQQVIAKRAKKEQLRDVITMLRGTSNSPQAEWLVRIMSKWAIDNHLKGVTVMQ